jgi:hypothetical protein
MASASSVVLIGLARLKRNADWQRLENWNWREKLSFLSHGVPAEIQVTEPAAMVAVKLRLPPGWRSCKVSGDGPQYSLVVGNEVAPPGLDRLNLLFRGNALISAAYQLESVLGALESDLDHQVAMLAAPERIFLRAGVVGWHGRAIVIAGRPHSGTSTLVAELLRAGASYYSDEYAVLDAQGWVHPFARPLWLCAGAGSNPVRYRADELGARVATRPMPVGLVVFPRYRLGVRAELAPLRPSAAAAELMDSMECAGTHPEAARAATRKALADAWILHGDRREAKEIVPLLLGPRRRGQFGAG